MSNAPAKEIIFFKPPWPWFKAHEHKIPEEDVECLIGLAKRCRLHRGQLPLVVEVGSFVGLSACAMATGVPCQVICVDHWNPDFDRDDPVSQWVSIEKDSCYEVFLKNTRPFPNIRHIKLPSTEAAKLFPDKSLDMVFIDASHRYYDVMEDIGTWLPKVRDGGILCGHDYSYFIGVREAVKKCFDDYVQATIEVWYKVVGQPAEPLLNRIPLDDVAPLAFQESANGR